MNTAHLRFPCFLGRRLHLGVTGSIAAYKSLELLRLLKSCHVSVGVTLTPSAQRFVGADSYLALGADTVNTAMFGPGSGDDPFVHLAPGQKAEALVIAPATANILAKMAHGLADDLLSTQVLAFRGPVVLAPAMNPTMWSAPATRQNWATLLERGARGVGPACGEVACGDSGEGKLSPVEHILAECLRALSPKDLQGRTVLLTMGPTREPWDAVRFLSNSSSGFMGACLAVSAWMRGATVKVVSGPTGYELPPGIDVISVSTARQMAEACADLWPGCDIGCCTAAVCDYRPVPPAGVEPGQKLKRRSLAGDLPVITLEENPDVLKGLGQSKRPGQTLIGFAAETGDLLGQARLKLEEKNLDLVVANRVDLPGSGFDSATNSVTVLDRNGRSEQWPELPKPEVAWRIWDLLLHL